MYIVYILYSRKYKKTYVGITDNLGRRLTEHNSGKSYYTRRYLPWTILYTEKYLSRQEARTREKYLKSRSGRRWMKKFLFEANRAGVAELADAQS